jgi:hypothetical protein
LYVWAIRHPASGYVQGINDLVTPFFEVFLSAYVGTYAAPRQPDLADVTSVLDCDPELFDTTQLPGNILAAIEADSFWCLSKLLDGIQDNYISAQPGIHRQVRRMAELVKRIDCESMVGCLRREWHILIHTVFQKAHLQLTWTNKAWSTCNLHSDG